MVLVWVVLVLVLAAALALLPIDRLPAWLNVYVGVAIACGIVVVVVALVT